MSMIGWVALVVAGALAALLRHLVELTVRERTSGALPWGTWVVNVTGSFLLGILTGLGTDQGLPRTARVVLGVGFCGAYTTFSAFAVETVRLWEGGATRTAVRNVAGTVVVALPAAAAGLALTAWV